ncbi:MAG: hypothetical protein AAF664_07185, partial [Planctomycetota bacterium]
MNHRRSQLWICIIVVLGILIAWDRWTALRSAENSLQNVVDQTDEIRKTLRRIEGLRDRPTVVASSASSPDEMIQLIESARVAAGWQPGNIISQQPQVPRRIDRSDYLQRATELRIRSVSLASLMNFCSGLIADDPNSSVGKRVSRILVRPTNESQIGVKPSNVSGGESWDVDLTLTQTIYSPKSQ